MYRFIIWANRGVLFKTFNIKATSVMSFEFTTPTKGTESVLAYTVSCFLTVRYFSWFCKLQFQLISAIVFSVTISNQLLRTGKFWSQFSKKRRYRAKLLLFSKKCWPFFIFLHPRRRQKFYRLSLAIVICKDFLFLHSTLFYSIYFSVPLDFNKLG